MTAAELMERLKARQITVQEFLAESINLPPAEKEKLTVLLVKWGQQRNGKRRAASAQDRDQALPDAGLAGCAIENPSGSCHLAGKASATAREDIRVSPGPADNDSDQDDLQCIAGYAKVPQTGHFRQEIATMDVKPPAQ